MDFDVIPFDDIKGNWKKLGSGSFGNVYKGSYLGIDVAIKEVLPSTEYDVAKYFEREWRLMKEARHPNVVLYLGLSRAPPPDGRIFIVSEFIEAGNLRTYLYNKTNPFPWRLRLSFSIDIARALAYLHARNCIHRDMKGENLLLTSNGRLKITDFGFARIAAQSAEERKRLTFCGTDSYMSPEILIGNEFGLSTDVYSLGIIFCEIITRKLADDNTFKRAPPYYELDTSELRELASHGSPEDFIKLAIQCCSVKPGERPNMLQILDRLRAIELEVLNRPSENENYHVGSVKLFTGAGTNRAKNGRPGLGPRIPSFGVGVGHDIRHSVGATKPANGVGDGGDSTPEETSEDEEIMEAISNIRSSALRAAEKKEESDTSSTAWSQVTVKQDGTRAFGNANDSLPLQHQHMESTAHKRDQHATDGSLSDEPLLQRHEQASLIYTDYSTSVVRSGKDGPPNLSSILTVRPSPNLANQPKPAEETKPGGHNEQEQELMGQPSIATLTTDSRLSTNSFHTAHTPSVMFDLDTVSIAGATEGGSTVRSEIIGGLHRFTLIKPGNISNKLSKGSTQSPTASTSWSPFQFFFSSFVSSKGSSGNASKVSSGGIAGKGSTAAAKCDLCHKRLGWKPVLECDDCGLRAHIKCGELAPRDCGMMQPLSPIGKGKGNAKNR